MRTEMRRVFLINIRLVFLVVPRFLLLFEMNIPVNRYFSNGLCEE